MAEDDFNDLEGGMSSAKSSDRQINLETGSNTFLRRLMDSNFLEYASYVIKERAIPDVDDGLKPVQRRILWSLHRMDDGKFHKVANVIGHTMQFHPHGDASIGGALVVLSNKEFFIEKQGNFGNILTGDEASAARYIECRLSPLGREVLFNNDITEFVDSYDGRNKEPVTLPIKIPSLLMLGAEGIAVGMATKIMPHNFNELLQAQISCLRGQPFQLYPDFLQGGTMDVSEYCDGNGKINLRARIDRDGRKLVIREVPASTTTEGLIASIERAAEKGKLKLAQINDYTTDKVEIEIVPMRGYDTDKALQALYAYTDCSMSVTVNMMLICENRPVQMSVPEVIKRNTAKLLEYLQRELEIELGKLQELYHGKTLAQIFIENRIYKRIEKCETNELVHQEVMEGLAPFRHLLNRDVTVEDIEKLLAIPIRRISLFDINKNKRDLEDILVQIEQVKYNLAHLTDYAIKYIESLLQKYGHLYPRRTEIETFEKIDRRAAALNNIKVGWDRKEGYIGTNVKSEDLVTCNEFDHLLLVERTGSYKVINIPEKIFVGRLYDFRKYDKDVEFGVIYSDKKSGKSYIKRCRIDKFITEREYLICPENCRLELFTPRTDAIYQLQLDAKIKDKKLREINLRDYPERSARARGVLLDSKKMLKVTHMRYLTEEELAALPMSEAELDPEDIAEDAVVIENELPVVAGRAVEESPQSVITDDVVENVDPDSEAPAENNVGASAEDDITAVTPEPPVQEQATGVVPEAVLSEPATRPRRKKTEKIAVEAMPVDKQDNVSAETPEMPVTPENSAEAVEESPVAPEVNLTEDTPVEVPDVAKSSVEPVKSVVPAAKEEPPKKEERPGDEWGIVQPTFGF